MPVNNHELLLWHGAAIGGDKFSVFGVVITDNQLENVRVWEPHRCNVTG